MISASLLIDQLRTNCQAIIFAFHSTTQSNTNLPAHTTRSHPIVTPLFIFTSHPQITKSPSILASISIFPPAIRASSPMSPDISIFPPVIIKSSCILAFTEISHPATIASPFTGT